MWRVSKYTYTLQCIFSVYNDTLSRVHRTKDHQRQQQQTISNTPEPYEYITVKAHTKHILIYDLVQCICFNYNCDVRKIRVCLKIILCRLFIKKWSCTLAKKSIIPFYECLQLSAFKLFHVCISEHWNGISFSVIFYAVNIHYKTELCEGKYVCSKTICR